MFRFRIIPLLLLMIFAQATLAQTQQKVTIEHATVFLSGAELASTAKLSLPQGETEMLFTNIAGNVNQQSLSVGADNGVVVQSATFQNNYLGNENLSPRGKNLKDSISLMEGNRSDVNNELTVLNEQIAILAQNRQVSGTQTGLSVAELQKMLDLVKARMGTLLSDKDRLTKQLGKTDERLVLLRKQLEEERQREFQPGGQLLVKFYSPRATSSDITITYVVPNAGWTPSYDIRVEKINDPVDLFYKANVYQNSGVKWTNVKLTLSTGNPSQGVQAPTLQPWYLAFYDPALYNQQIQKYNESRTRNVSGAVNTAPGVYQSREGEGMNLGGGRTDATLYVIDGVQVVGGRGTGVPVTMNQYTSVDNSGINTNFDIDLPYTIPSDGQQHMVAIKKYELPASYRYYAAPKIDRDAFLQAQVTGWEDLNLLPGQSNVFYEGTYVGQGMIDMRSVKDTMNISLGRDKKIIIRRERDRQLRSVKTIGSNVRETFAYTISIRNTRNAPIGIVINDQIPISNDNTIEVEDRETGGASYNETTGALTWTVQLKANETKTLKLGYTIKYPKGKTLNVGN